MLARALAWSVPISFLRRFTDDIALLSEDIRDVSLAAGRI
jgi:hypothetical protein